MRKPKRTRNKALTFYFSDEALKLLRETADITSYRITQISIVERGIVLASEEIKRMVAAAKKQPSKETK